MFLLLYKSVAPRVTPGPDNIKTVQSMLRSFSLSAVLLILLSSSSLFPAEKGRGADRSRYFPLDHPVYGWLDRAQERGMLLGLNRALRPYTREQVRLAVKAQSRKNLKSFEQEWLDHLDRECSMELNSATSTDSSDLRILVRAEASADIRSLRPDRHDESAGLGFGGRFGNVVFDARFLRAPHLLGAIDSTEHRDPDVQSPREEGLIRPMEGYLKADFASHGGAFGVELFFGRMARNWSPLLDESLILSGRALSFDHFGLALRSKHLTFSHLIARLNGMNYRNSASDSWQRANRFMSIHRLDIRVRNSLRFGITESTVYGGPGASFDPALMNPFTSYRLTAIQDSDDHANNTLLALDGFVNIAGRASLFGQFLFDDFLRRPDIQDRWAASLGLDLRDPPPLESVTLGLRGTVASSYVYNTFRPWERYLIEGRSLGAPEGNDYWSAGAFVRKFLGPNLDLTARMDISGRGALRIASPSMELIGSGGRPFPTPVVEHTSAAGLSLRWQAFDWAEIEAGGGIQRVRNQDNSPGDNKRKGFGSISISLYRDYSVSF